MTASGMMMSTIPRRTDIPKEECQVPRVPKADIARREALLSLLEHVHRETIGVNLAIPVGPKAIHLIALDTFDGHQWPSRPQPNKIATAKRRSGLALCG